MQPISTINPITNHSPKLKMGSLDSAPEQKRDSEFEPVLSIDPSLKHLYQEGKIECDGKLRLENITLPETVPLQPDAMKHIRQFMTVPFVIQGTVTESVRQHIRHILGKRLQEPAVAYLLEMDFMKKTEPLLLKTQVLPAHIFLKLLDVFNGEYFKLIGGEARKSLKTTFMHMVELIQQKPCVLPPKKEKEFLKTCPDWDFILPAEQASYEQLMHMSDIVPNLTADRLFGQNPPEVQQLLQFVVREVLFKISKIFDKQYSTGVSFGNPDKKIDITFLPTFHHNFFFEFNKVGITIHRNALVEWLNDPIAPCEKHLSLDVSLCGADKGLQAGFDYIHGILRSSHYQDVNKRGFASLMLWLSRGFTCVDMAVLVSFYKRLEDQGNLDIQIAEQLSLSHESHFKGNLKLFLATYLNAFLSVDEINPKQVDSLFQEVMKQLGPKLSNEHYRTEKPHTFEILLQAIHTRKFNTRYYLNWLTICAFFSPAEVRKSFGKTALQLTDDASLLLPFEDLSCFENSLMHYSPEYRDELNKLFSHLVAASDFSDGRLSILSEDQKEQLKTFSLKFLEHPDPTLRKVGLRIHLLFSKSNQDHMVKFLLPILPILKEETPDTLQRITKYLKSCFENLPQMEKLSILLDELIALLNTDEPLSNTKQKWLSQLLRTRDPQLLEMGRLLWKDLPSDEKAKRADEYLTEMSSISPQEALGIFNQYVNHPDWDQLGDLIVKLRNTTDSFLAYGLHLEKAVAKTLASHEVIQVKGRKKRSHYHKEFFWLFTKLSPMIHDKAPRLLKKLHAAGCIDLDSTEMAEELIRLQPELPPDIFFDIWSFAQGHACPLLSLKSHEKNECLVSLCEKLFLTKHFQLDGLLKHTISQDLDDKQKERIQKVIQEFGTLDPALRNYLSQDQITDMSIDLMYRQLKEKQYSEVSRGIEKIWTQLPKEKRVKILDLEFQVCTSIRHEMKQHSHDKRKELAFLAPLIETRFSLFDKVSSSELSSELANLWVVLLIDYVELSFDPHSPSTKLSERLRPFTPLLIERLNDKRSYGLALDFLQAVAYRSISVEPTPLLIGLVAEVAAQSPDIHKIEQTLGLLKFYQHPGISPNLQIAVYSDLIRRLFEAESPKATQWVERLFSFCSKDNQLPGALVIDWVDKLTPQKDASLFSKIYAHLDRVRFDDEDDLKDLLNHWVNTSPCPYFAAKLICEHTYHFFSGCTPAQIMEMTRNVLISWIKSPSPECTEEISFVLKLFFTHAQSLNMETAKQPPLSTTEQDGNSDQIKDAELSCGIIEIISKSPTAKFREDSWFIFEVARSSGAFTKHPQLKAKACLHALRGISGLQPAIFRELLLSVELIRQYFKNETFEDYEEALWIIFKANLDAMKEMKDHTKDTLSAMTILSTRNYLKEIKPWSRIDRLIVSEMTKMGDKMIIVPLLSSIKNRYLTTPGLDLNSILQLIFESLPLDKADCFIALNAFLIDYLDVINVYPFIKKAIKHPLHEAVISTGLLVPYLMNQPPKENDRNEKILISCLATKIADLKSEDKRILKEILDHPEVSKWLSDHVIAKCWENIIVGDLEREARSEHPLSVVALTSFEINFHRLSPDSYPRCLHAGVCMLIRLLIEGSELDLFHRHTIRFFKTLMKYQGKTPTAAPREPRDLPRTAFAGKTVLSKEDLASTLQRIRLTELQMTTLGETKRQRDNPVFSFPDFEAMLEFIITEIQGKDELHAPEFVVRGMTKEDMPELSQELQARIIKETTQKIEPADEPKEPVEIETIDYIFEEKTKRDFYILGMSELLRQMCGFHTTNLAIRKVVMVCVARQILFLVEHYREYRSQLFDLVHHYVFAPSLVDFNLGQYRTARGRERMDLSIFNKHNEWCHEIITTMREYFSKDVQGYPRSFYESMLVIYPFEIYPMELSVVEQSNVIFSTVEKLLLTKSSIHFARALEIVRTHQNIFLNEREGILDCYHSLIFAMLNDPYYLINESNLIIFGPESDRRECLYITKRPLFQLLSIALRENNMKFGKTRSKEFLSIEIDKSINTGATLSVQFVNALFDLMENSKLRDPHYDILDLIISSLMEFAKRGCFVSNHALYRDFVVRLEPFVFAHLREARNKKEALCYNNLAFLFLIPFQLNRAQKENWVRIFNGMIRQLLEIKDKEMNQYVMELVKTDFINKGFYCNCKPLLAEMKTLLESHSSSA